MRPHHSRVGYTWESFSSDLVRDVLQKARAAFHEKSSGSEASPQAESVLGRLEKIWKRRLDKSQRAGDLPRTEPVIARTPPTESPPTKTPPTVSPIMKPEGASGERPTSTRKRWLNVTFSDPIDLYQEEEEQVEPDGGSDETSDQSEESLGPDDALDDTATQVALLDDGKACPDLIVCQHDSIDYDHGVWTLKLRNGVMQVGGEMFHFRIANGEALYK